MEIKVVTADYTNRRHGEDIGFLIDSYARDPMGGATPLADSVRNNLSLALAKLPHAFSILCYVDNKPAGLINCFDAFSTFKCKPLVNIHDIIVLGDFRGLGLSQLMLQKVEGIAKDKGCCKLTLEVLEGNKVAQGSYRKYGFSGYELDPNVGRALFWEKHIGPSN
ncbi:GNAT family N-acetyltransferase [Gammaproteobacteria bacterium 45_16_T64]|nr:GNAT family N-acetyltransferase [Gammaproteobacteria bacterium 45_16_T64]